MKHPCKITVFSSRSLSALDFFPPEEEPEEVEEVWEEILEEMGLEFPSTPSDRWEEAPKELPPSPHSATTLTAHGLFSIEEDGSFRISYEDSEITGLEGCLTTFCLTATGMLIMLRRGTVKTCMVFENAHRHLCDYGAGGGIPSVFLHTHSLKSDLTEEGGTVEVEYSVEIRGAKTEHNLLTITVECHTD